MAVRVASARTPAGRRAPLVLPRGAAGFTLVELLLASSLGVILTLALVQLFASTGGLQAAVLGQARVQESARHALDFLARSARGAGHFGCSVAGGLENGLNGAWGSVVEFNAASALEAFEGVADGTWRPPLDRLPVRGGAATLDGNAIDPARLRPGSDIVVFRRLRQVFALAGQVATDAAPLVVLDAQQVLDDDQFALLGDCGRATLLRITSVARDGGAATLAHGDGVGAFGNRAGLSLLPADGAAWGGDSGPGAASVGVVHTEIYFVARSADSARGAPAWALWRKSGSGRPAELVRGIDEMQLLFGLDETPGDASTAPNRYVAAHSLSAADARSLRIEVTASSVEAAGGGRPLSFAFFRTVALRNL